MDIKERELLQQQVFKNKKLENEIQDLKDKLTAEKMRNKSELQMNLDLKVFFDLKSDAKTKS